MYLFEAHYANNNGEEIIRKVEFYGNWKDDELSWDELAKRLAYYTMRKENLYLKSLEFVSHVKVNIE